MNELQIGLVALGGAAVLGVFGYNKWQERQHRKVAERVFRQPQEDVLLGGGHRVEPEMAAPEPEDDWADSLPGSTPEAEWTSPGAEPAQPVEVAGPVGNKPQEHAIEDSSSADAEPVGRVVLPEPQDIPLPAGMLSPRVDAIATLELVEPVFAWQFLAALRDTLQRLRKPIHWVGFNETQGAWEFIAPESHHAYRRLRVGLQLANRQGPLAAGDFSLFAGAMQQLADELMAVADLPSSQVALDQAVHLDRFCADVDMQIGVNLVSRGTPFPGTKIRALAEAAGMTLGANHVYSRYDDDGHLLFTLQNFEATGFVAETLKSMSTHGLIFLLDVPRVPKGQVVYTQMVEIAKRFADVLNGALVDDNRQPLTDVQLTHIRQEYVLKPQAAMETQGIPAGSSLALRLFA